MAVTVITRQRCESSVERNRIILKLRRKAAIEDCLPLRGRLDQTSEAATEIPFEPKLVLNTGLMQVAKIR